MNSYHNYKQHCYALVSFLEFHFNTFTGKILLAVITN